MEWLFNLDYKVLLENLKRQKLSVDLFVCDPPYQIDNIVAGNKSGSIQESLTKAYSALEQYQIRESYDIAGFSEYIKELQPKGINTYFWCNKIQIPAYLDQYVEKMGCKFDILFWGKTNPPPTYSNKYLTDCEYCLYFRRGGNHCKPSCYEDAHTYWIEKMNKDDKKLWEHPTIKPLRMIERLVKNSSKEGELVCDPFMGSGTTGVACKRLGRNFIGTDLNEKWYEIAKQRIEES